MVVFHGGGGGGGGGGGVFSPGPLLSGVAGNNNDTLLRSPPVAGDLIYANGTPLWAARGIGSAGQLLMVSAGFPVWSSAGAVVNLTDAATIVVNAALWGISGTVRVTIAADGHTFGNPSSPTDGQTMLLEVLSAAAHTIAFDTDYDGSIIALPTATTGGGLVDVFYFVYRSTEAKWFLVGTTQASASTGANNALSNLAAVAVNLALTPGVDNTIAVNSSAKRFTSLFLSTGAKVLAAASDANGTTELGSAQLTFGVGGATAPSVGIARDVDGVLKITDGGSGGGTLKTAITMYVDLIDAATIATDSRLGNCFRVTLGASRTLGNPSNPISGQKYLWQITQDGSGGHTLTPDTKFRFGTNTPDFSGLDTTIGGITYIAAVYDDVADKFDVVSLLPGF